jgi:hypothetical protein
MRLSIEARIIIAATLVAAAVPGITRTASAQAPPRQAVIETTAGTVVLDLLPRRHPTRLRSS